jgi:hypothetical protein
MLMSARRMLSGPEGGRDEGWAGITGELKAISMAMTCQESKRQETKKEAAETDIGGWPS